ncbi:MAG: hypothetical protein ACKO96_09355 [Flammeovirgaceae bacterium]
MAITPLIQLPNPAGNKIPETHNRIIVAQVGFAMVILALHDDARAELYA